MDTEEDDDDTNEMSNTIDDEDQGFIIGGRRLLKPKKIGESMMSKPEFLGGGGVMNSLDFGANGMNSLITLNYFQGNNANDNTYEMQYDEATERIKEASRMETALSGFLIPSSARQVMRARLSN